MKKHLKIFNLLALLFLSACGNKIITSTDESSRFKITPFLKGAAPDFNTLKNNILIPYCIQCHSWAAKEEEVLKRVVPKKPQASTLFQEIDSGKMPQGLPRLTEVSIDLVRRYIDGVGSTPPIPPAPPLKATYSSLKFHLMEKSCLSCHNAEEAVRRKIPNLKGKDKVQEKADEILYSMTTGREIDDGPMPPKRSSAPIATPEIIATFQEWMAAGFPD